MAGSLRTPLGRVRGLGAAKSGTGHFIAMRITSVALAALAPWFVISAALHLDGSYETSMRWIAQPLNAVLMILLVLASFYHMGAGMRTIIEDYIQKHESRIVLLLGNMFLWVSMALAGVYAILKASLGS